MHGNELDMMMMMMMMSVCVCVVNPCPCGNIVAVDDFGRVDLFHHLILTTLEGQFCLFIIIASTSIVVIASTKHLAAYRS